MGETGKKEKVVADLKEWKRRGSLEKKNSKGRGHGEASRQSGKNPC